VARVATRDRVSAYISGIGSVAVLFA